MIHSAHTVKMYIIPDAEVELYNNNQDINESKKKNDTKGARNEKNSSKNPNKSKKKVKCKKKLKWQERSLVYIDLKLEKN